MKILKKVHGSTFVIILFIVISSLLLTLYIHIRIRKNNELPFTFSSVAMGTYINQTVLGSDSKDVCLSALDSIESLEGEISWRINTSSLARLNSCSPNKYIEISSDAFNILSIALDVAQCSNGAFDPTILPLSSLWDFGGINQRLPNINEIKSVIPYINYNNIKLDKSLNRAMLLSSHTKLDLGGAGKGSACEAAVKQYKAHDVDYGIISAGGSIGVYGHKKNLEPFKIGIRDPFLSSNTCEFATFNIESGFVSTSGAYERNFTQDNKFYHHILYPKTGYPVENDLMSVTVYHESNGTLTDALSTACFVLGKEDSMRILEKYNASAVFVDKYYHVFTSGIFKDNLKIINENFFIDN